MRRFLFNLPKWMWLPVAVLLALDAAGIYLLVNDYRADEARAEEQRVASQKAAAVAAEPKGPPPPAMIHPLPVASALQSGTLIVISKASQNMFVFNDGVLWATTPISTGKRRHETPSGVFPILQKRKHHRSNIYSRAPMPYMQRLTWDGIALHAGWVPGYPASHGCVRVPKVFAEALFKLTNMNVTTVVIGDDPLLDDLQARQFALSGAAKLPVRSALAPPAEPASEIKVAANVAKNMTAAIIGASKPVPQPPAAPTPPVAPAVAGQPVVPVAGAQTIQLAAATSQAEAEAYWARLQTQRPDMRRYAKSVEVAQVNARTVYRLRISGADAFSYCTKLKSEGVSCLNVS